MKNGYKNFIVGNEVWGNRNELACAACTPGERTFGTPRPAGAIDRGAVQVSR